jgi:hypothetical protein
MPQPERPRKLAAPLKPSRRNFVMAAASTAAAPVAARALIAEAAAARELNGSVRDPTDVTLKVNA